MSSPPPLLYVRSSLAIMNALCAKPPSKLSPLYCHSIVHPSPQTCSPRFETRNITTPRLLASSPAMYIQCFPSVTLSLHTFVFGAGSRPEPW
ncbi:hypothetical protein B0H19DRAFT_275113 [Mycena capillaripes]|nr:hypothetical protein B0H19DRAFT_275113 [Mycena capillaripes]